MTTKTKDDVVAAKTGAEIFVPLNKLKKSPRNARKTGHSAASIEALAASIAAKGMLQNLVVEPNSDADGAETGFYFVTIGEGRRLAQLQRVKRKEIKKTEPIRCVLDLANDPHEISLDENVTREAMHPADQFEAFRKLVEDHGWGAEEIAARFGVTPHIVRQRLRLGAVSPKLMQDYRDGNLSLDQLMAFAITEDHARQEEVFARLSYNKDACYIRRMLMEAHIPAQDRRAVFVGPEVYEAAGGVILRDLFLDDRGGYFEDAALLDRLTLEKLQKLADEAQAEGWKWAEAHLDYPHGHGMRRIYPEVTDFPPEEQARYDALLEERDALTEEAESSDDVSETMLARLDALEGEIDALRLPVFDSEDIARCGVFIVLNYDGTPRIERGYVRPEDEKPRDTKSVKHPGVESGEAVAGEGSAYDDDDGRVPAAEDGDHAGEGEDDGVKPLSDLLIRDLTAHRTLGLRLALGDDPDIALVSLAHAFAAQAFYRGHEGSSVSCLEIKLSAQPLAGHADGIEDSEGAVKLSERHTNWARQMPRDPADLWAFIVGLHPDSRMALLAHCASLSVFAVDLPWDRKPLARAHADDVALALAFDMNALWRPTARSYFGRVTKARIIEAVRESVGEEAASRISNMKKQVLAEAAEALVAGTGWLPELLRTAGSGDAGSSIDHAPASPEPETCHEAIAAE